MVATSLLIQLVSAFALNQASPARRDLVLHERAEGVPSGFVQNGPAPASSMLSMHLALVSSNLTGLEETLYAVSTPGSERYGHYLTKQEVAVFVAPTKETTEAVQGFLTANNITAATTSLAGDWLSFSIPVSQANDLFAADFNEFTHGATGTKAIRTLAYSIPATLQGKINLVHPTVAFPVLTGHLPVMSTYMPKINSNTTSDIFSPSPNVVPASCNSEITPACLEAMYGFPASAIPSDSQIAVTSYGQQPQTADLQSFLTSFRTDIPSSTTFSTRFIDGGSSSQGVGAAGEANLDIQYTVGVAGGVPVTLISIGPNSGDGVTGSLDIITFLTYYANQPQVWTTSYGSHENVTPLSIAKVMCNAYMALGARGTSIFFSSGDGGVSGIQPQTCTTFVPTFPSSCPFVTSIGATTGITETSASFSSGGFSNYFARPSYQNSAVSTYLNTLGSTNAGLYNASGRGIPDIAAQGENFIIFNGGQQQLASGTSCSSPTIAAIFSLLNAELLAAGKPVVGFLNPFIYANPSVFNDITTGNNPGCGTNGFTATAGWDPVTGFGSPNYANLRTAFGL